MAPCGQSIPNTCAMVVRLEERVANLETVGAFIREAHDREHALLEKAREDTRSEMERRLAQMNELREQTVRIERECVKRDEWQDGHEALTTSLNVKYDHLVTQIQAQAESTSKAMQSQTRNDSERLRSLERFMWMGMGAASLIGLLSGIAMHWLKP